MGWNYEAMYKWYTKQDMIKSDLYEIIYPIIYHSKRPAKKDINKVEPFVKQNITYVGESPVTHPDYPDGVYLLYGDKSDEKKWLYFVMPKYVQCQDANHKELLANHLTFCYDKSDKKKPCHFHSTEYYCIKRKTAIEYNYNHHKDFFPDKLDSFDNIITNPSNQDLRDFVLQIMKHPQKAGGKTKIRKPKTQVARPITNHAFCDLWYEYNIKSITAFGIVKDNKVHFTIKIVGPGKIVNNRRYTALYFVCDKNENYEAMLQDFLSKNIYL